MVLLQQVSKEYQQFAGPLDRLRELIPGASPAADSFWALRNVSLHVGKGEILGVVGPNGGGKTTLLQVVAGILPPTSGRVVTRGRIAALLELATGFNAEFSGRENVLLYGQILGMSAAEISKALPAVIEFAELGAFFERPVQEYSSGMYQRLAFAAAIHTSPDILIVDEALAVGDAVFANRCIQKIRELRRRRASVLFVSHDLNLVQLISDRAILLSGGKIESEGAPREVINRYLGMVLDRQPSPIPKGVIPASFRHGDGGSEVVGVEILDCRGVPAAAFSTGEPVTVRVRARFHTRQSDPIVGLIVRTADGNEVYVTNTRMERVALGDFRSGDELEVSFQMECWLTPRHYTLTVATANADGTSHDWLDDAIAFQVTGGSAPSGVVNLRAEVQWRKTETPRHFTSTC